MILNIGLAIVGVVGLYLAYRRSNIVMGMLAAFLIIVASASALAQSDTDTKGDPTNYDDGVTFLV
jgi:hypothetical protein